MPFIRHARDPLDGFTPPTFTDEDLRTYRAEHRAMACTPVRQFKSPIEFAERVDEIVERTAALPFADCYVPDVIWTMQTNIVFPGGDFAYAQWRTVGGGLIEYSVILPCPSCADRYLNDRIALHEVAHHMSPPGPAHGWEFRETYLFLCKIFAPEYGQILRIWFDAEFGKAIAA